MKEYKTTPRNEPVSKRIITPEERARRKEHGKEYESRPDVKARKKEYRNRPEVKAIEKELRDLPENKERRKEYQKEYLARPEVVARRKEQRKEYQSRPEVKAKRKEYYSRPEIRAKVREVAARPENKAKAKEHLAKPEIKARKRELSSRPDAKARRKEYASGYSISIWKEIFDIYGWKCACCGEDNTAFLTVDHIGGGGRKERTEIGSRLYRAVIEANDPTKYQILCFNCNSGRAMRGIGGVCPHKLPKNWRFEGKGTS